MRGRRAGGLIGVALLAGVLLTVNLGGYRLWDPDESKHAEIAREMLVRGNPILPSINFEPYHDKPSGFYLLVGIAYRIWGVNEFAARIVPALACWTTILLVYLFGSSHIVSRGVDDDSDSTVRGLVCAGLLMSAAFYEQIGRFTNFDALVTLMVVAAVLYLGWWMSHPRPRPGLWPFYAAVAFGVLIKGPMAIALVVVPTAGALITRELSLQDLQLPRGLLIMGAIIALWGVPAALMHPDYIADFLWNHNVRRYFVQGSFHDQPFYFFVPIVFGSLLPWSPLLWHAVTDSLERGGALRLLAVYSLWEIVFFSSSATKLGSYVVPAFPTLAVLVGVWLVRIRRSDPMRARRAVDVAAVFMFLLLPLALVWIGREEPGLWAACWWLLPASLAGAGVLTLRRTWMRETFPSVVVLSCGSLAFLFACNVFVSPQVSDVMGDHDLAVAAVREGKPTEMVAYGVRPYSFLFYTGWPLTYRVGTEDLAEALSHDGVVMVLTKKRRLPEIAGLLSPAHWWECAANNRHLLLKNRPCSVALPKNPVSQQPAI